LANTYNYVGVTHGERREYGQALHYLRKALEIRESFAKKDSASDTYPFEVADSQAQIGFVYSARALRPHALPQEERVAGSEAITWFGRALPVFQRRKEQGKLKWTELATYDSLKEQMDKCKRLLHLTPGTTSHAN